MGSNGININETLSNTIQTNYSSEGWAGPMSLLMIMARTNDLISPWWSRRRDIELRNFVNSSDHISGAMYNLVSKMTTIPIKIVPRDKSIKAHVEMAERYTENLLQASQFGDGWMNFYSRFLSDLFGQDNGAFAEVIGPGDPNGPLTGMPYGIAHLDSARCRRTGNAMYPVIYEGFDGKLYKLHFTRVIMTSQMPSARSDMYGVGFCAVSRVLNAAQNLMDISLYKQEKLGSRPQRQLFITGGGLDPEDLQMAFSVADRQMDNMGLSRFSKTVVAGNRNIVDPKLQVVDMAGIPDGFDEKESTILGMAIVAMGFGMDARELFPAMESGATKADAIVQHIKQRGKAPGQTIQMTENMLNMKYLPPYLTATFDYQDDEQDRQVAEIQSVRAQSRERDLSGRVTSVRVERERMVRSGEITDEQFEQLELEDGRLEDGITVDVLFYSEEKDFKEFLGDVNETNYEERITDIMREIINSRDKERIKNGRKAIAAINFKYVKPMEEQMAFEQQMMLMQKQPTNTGQEGDKPDKPDKPDTSYDEEKFGRKLGRSTVRLPNEEQNYTS